MKAYRFSWYGHIMRRDPGNVTRVVLDKDTLGPTLGGRPRISWMNNIRREERYENVWSRRPNEGRQECVVKDGGNGRHTLVYKTQYEKVTRIE